MRTVLTKSEDGAFLIKKYLTFIGNFGPSKFLNHSRLEYHTNRSSRSEVFCNFIKKETLAQLLSSEFL